MIWAANFLKIHRDFSHHDRAFLDVGHFSKNQDQDKGFSRAHFLYPIFYFRDLFFQLLSTHSLLKDQYHTLLLYKILSNKNIIKRLQSNLLKEWLWLFILQVSKKWKV